MNEKEKEEVESGCMYMLLSNGFSKEQSVAVVSCLVTALEVLDNDIARIEHKVATLETGKELKHE
jgi:hypothetical protein